MSTVVKEMILLEGKICIISLLNSKFTEYCYYLEKCLKVVTLEKIFQEK